MYHYLLADLGCGTCSSISNRIREEVGDTIIVRGLAEMEIQQYLKKALPEWKREPMLMEVSEDGENIQVYTGVLMRLRLIQILGITTAWRVVSLVYQSVRPVISISERRTFLKYSGGVAAGLAVLGLRPLQTQAKLVLENTDTNERATVTELTGADLENAVVESESNQNMVVVTY